MRLIIGAAESGTAPDSPAALIIGSDVEVPYAWRLCSVFKGSPADKIAKTTVLVILLNSSSEFLVVQVER
jgi:hypothetical protein